MLIASYNPAQTGDILVVMVNPDAKEEVVEFKDDVVKIADADTHQATGFNFLNASQILPRLKGLNGEIHLNNADLLALNQVLKANDWDDEIKMDLDPKFVVGYVKAVRAHPKSDHLQITETQINDGKTLQIVSGSPNMQADIKVVVAKVGAMMPDGLIILPGELKGVDSDGMICSGRELKIPNAPQKPGALILPTDYQSVGEAFDFDKAITLFK
jgi:tRNA-binding protein